MTRSILESGAAPGAAAMAASYNDVTADSIQSFFSAALQSSPTMASVGDIANVPYHATIARRFS